GLLLAAGLGAGVVNGVAGGGTLISFPALMAAGYPALRANVTSTIGIWPGYLGGSAGFRKEIVAQRMRLRGLAPSMVVGAVLGGVLLLTTPSRGFRRLAPFLLLSACALFALQPYVTAYFHRSGTAQRTKNAILHAGSLAAATYGAYFGAGLGVLLLALLATTLPEPLTRVNGLRSVMSLIINTVAALVFVVHAHVAWAAAGLMAASALAGGYVGARAARVIPSWCVRVFVIAVGIASAADLLASQH
ncbi:MAG TPA: sulfite exporter TauE/SafE family protein, partial [Acidimicrobiales bacterium]|nr:sulfite exporter TauE/SafE family protein [Acidimicrobiales bacterium]